MEASLQPSWLNDSFLIEVLHAIELDETKPDVKVMRWTCHSVVPPGSNFMSNLYCVKVHFTARPGASAQSKTFIVKAPLEGGLSRAFAEENRAYKREQEMYVKVLSRMNELHSWRGTPRSFQAPLDNFLILEDLRDSGYRTAKRLEQLDVSHCRQTLLCLSRLHALSLAVHRSDPGLIESVGDLVWYREGNPNRAREECVLKTFLNGFLYTIKTMKECERYVGPFSKKIDGLYDKYIDIFKPANGLNVLNHGDLWSSNILFKYNESNEVIDAKLVDFQFCVFGSFAHDIYFFWFTSANEAVRDHHREEMFELYRQNLNTTLQEVGSSERLSKEDFDRQMRTCAPVALQIIARSLSVSLTESFDFSKVDFDVNKPLKEDSYNLTPFRSEYYRALLPKILQQAEELGAFE